MLPAIFHSHFAADPYFNMAFDEQMFSHVLSNPGVVLLRLYTWKLPTITLGLHQNAERAVDFSRLGQTPLIRRVSGGRAVYHDCSELTYSMAANVDDTCEHQLRGSTSAVHLTIARALKRYLERCEMDSQVIRRSSPANSAPEFFHTAPCFASVSRDEIVSGERKVLASAQRRIGNAFLQHGSIKLFGLAAHPALPHTDGSVSTAIDSVDAARFAKLASKFEATMMQELDLRRCPASGAPDLSGAAAESCQALKKKALGRRNNL